VSPRRRSEKRRGFPPNLYETGGYYSWRHPKTGEHFGLGRDRSRSFREAIAANATLEPSVSLVDRIKKKKAVTWGEWIPRYRDLLAKRTLAATTRRAYKSMLGRAEATFPADTPAEEVSTLMIAEAIDALAETKPRMAQAFRSFLRDSFRCMIAKGIRKDNPVDVTDFVNVQVQRARLTFEVFQALYNRAPTMLKNAMALSLVSGQAREECCSIQFKDAHDGYLWIERGKTGARIALPLSLRLDRFGVCLDDVIRQCRTTGIVSHWLVHRIDKAKGARIGSHVHVDVLTRDFSAEVEKLGMDWGGKQPPTFHEIRSLAGRMYKEQGNVNPQELFGHKDARTTAVYTDGRGEWVKVGVRS
jgi:integrase